MWCDELYAQLGSWLVRHTMSAYIKVQLNVETPLTYKIAATQRKTCGILHRVVSQKPLRTVWNSARIWQQRSCHNSRLTTASCWCRLSPINTATLPGTRDQCSRLCVVWYELIRVKGGSPTHLCYFLGFCNVKLERIYCNGVIMPSSQSLEAMRKNEWVQYLRGHIHYNAIARTRTLRLIMTFRRQVGLIWHCTEEKNYTLKCIV